MVVSLIIAIISTVKSTATPTTRERLLDAAARVIARDGFQGARLADVAREAGLTTGAIYSNFRDKEDLFVAAFDQVQQLGAELAEAGPGVDGLIESFRFAAARFENSRQLQVLNLELALLGARNARVRHYLRAGLGESVETVAKELPGEDDAERRELAALLIALSNGIALVRMLAPDQVSIEAAERALRRLAGV